MAGYVKWRLTKSNGCFIRNFQTVYLASREKDMKIAEETIDDLKIALERINIPEFVGMVEFFIESIARLKVYLYRTFSGIDTFFMASNKSNYGDRKWSIEERIEEIRLALGSNLYYKLIKKIVRFIAL
jgi:hypothetical protein